MSKGGFAIVFYLYAELISCTYSDQKIRATVVCDQFSPKAV